MYEGGRGSGGGGGSLFAGVRMNWAEETNVRLSVYVCVCVLACKIDSESPCVYLSHYVNLWVRV